LLFSFWSISGCYDVPISASMVFVSQPFIVCPQY